MAYGEKEEIKKPQHEWEREWSSDDWRKHSSELMTIGKVYEEILERSSSGTLHPYKEYQRVYGGMKFEGIYEIATDKYDEINWKLTKYKLWKERNLSPEDRSNSRDRIRQMFETLKISELSESKKV